MEIQYSTYNFLQICGKLKKFDILENDKSSKYEWTELTIELHSRRNCKICCHMHHMQFVECIDLRRGNGKQIR